MRKFLLRWWYTPNWRADTYHRMMLDWNGNWLVVDIGPDPYAHLWQHSDGIEHAPEGEIKAAVAYVISPDVMDEAFVAECEVVKRGLEAEIRRIVGIDVESGFEYLKDPFATVVEEDGGDLTEELWRFVAKPESGK